MNRNEANRAKIVGGFKNEISVYLKKIPAKIQRYPSIFKVLQGQGNRMKEDPYNNLPPRNSRNLPHLNID